MENKKEYLIDTDNNNGEYCVSHVPCGIYAKSLDFSKRNFDLFPVPAWKRGVIKSKVKN